MISYQASKINEEYAKIILEKEISRSEEEHEVLREHMSAVDAALQMASDARREGGQAETREPSVTEAVRSIAPADSASHGEPVIAQDASIPVVKKAQFKLNGEPCPTCQGMMGMMPFASQSFSMKHAFGILERFQLRVAASMAS